MTDFDRFEAMSFDCYGTLIDWETGISAELVPWAERRGVAASRAELVARFAATETGVQQEEPGALYPDVLAEVLRRIGRQLDVPVYDEEATAFGASVGAWPAFDDSVEALTRLKSRYRLAILSNVDRASFAKSAARLGVDFDLVVTAQDVGAYKPSAAELPGPAGAPRRHRRGPGPAPPRGARPLPRSPAGPSHRPADGVDRP